MGTLRANVGRFICLLIIILFTLSPSSLCAVQRASIVICAETGKIYHAQDANAITHPASLTKMMTLYLTFKALREGKLTLNQRLPVSKHATLPGPTKLWLKAGSTITVRDAILALVTKSANDAAVVLAEALGNGSEVLFATKMTHQAHHLGMSNTVFKNAHGLPNKAQVTTALDMATLSRCLYKHFPEYFKFFKEEQFVYKGQVHPNHNRLLGKIPGLDGIKTGFINASGFNLAASVVRGNHRIIAVVMGGESAQSRDKKMVRLLEATYANLTGKNGSFQKYQDCSIGDLICALEPSQAAPIKAKMHKAVLRQGQCRPAKIMTPKYTSVAHLLNDIDDDEVSEKPSRMRVQKIVKKSPTKVTKNRVRKVDTKKAKVKKATTKRKRRK